MSDFLRPSRLDQPRTHRKRLPIIDADAFGRISERIARFLGTGRFLGFQTVIVAIWIVFNLFAAKRGFDPYPFILLNLAFSTQAAYAAPLILLAQNRQADRDRVSLEEDRQRALAAKADTEYLARELAALRLAIGEVATREYLRSELSRLLDEVRSVQSDDEREPRPEPATPGPARPRRAGRPGSDLR
jgi:uncharacterized membrane protein